MQAETGTTSDLDVLVDLNRDYFRSAQTSDTKWFRDTLADDFRCSRPDGTLIDRERFLERAHGCSTSQASRSMTVDVRLLDSVAIVHAHHFYHSRRAFRDRSLYRCVGTATGPVACGGGALYAGSGVSVARLAPHIEGAATAGEA